MVRYLLLIYLVTYFLIAFVLPTYRVWKRTGVNPVTFAGSDNAHDLIGKFFKVVMAALAAVVLINTFFPDWNVYLLPVFWLESEVVRYAGVALLLISLVWTIAAQLQMGDSWRIGIDEQEATGLVRSGIFGYSRNPIFLGMIVSLFGFFLALPNAFTMLFMVLGWALIQIQVRLEEEWLRRTHGRAYSDYEQNVRRWL